VEVVGKQLRHETFIVPALKNNNIAVFHVDVRDPILRYDRIHHRHGNSEKTWLQKKEFVIAVI